MAALRMPMGFRYHRGRSRISELHFRAALTRPKPAPEAVVAMYPLATALLTAAALLPIGCAGPDRGAVEPPPGPQMAAVTAQAGAASGAGADLGIDLRQPPRSRSAEEPVTDLPDAGEQPGPDPGTALPDGDPVVRQAVAERCADRPASITEESLLRSLVVDLNTQGVPPALAADALIIGRCGDLADIVTEVVARGGADAAVPVIERAVALTGDAAAPVVERAAAAGLLLAGRERVNWSASAPSPLAGADGDYAMLYFPLGGDAAAGETGPMSLAQLFGHGEPGYGIYTYIVYGGDAGAAGERLAAYRELLRVIETYVLVAGAGNLQADPSAHTFLVPVYAGRDGAPLEERTGPELSAAMRDELASHLRRGGQPALAARLATSPGPFLVSSLEPRLVPGSAQAPRMIVDLSGVGPEYMYSVVDAYDQQIPPDLSGRVDSLLAVRERLIGMFPDGVLDANASSPAAGDWVFLLGRRTTAQIRAATGGALAMTDQRR